MSNPVYGFCAAGCKYEVAKQEDLDAAVQKHDEIRLQVQGVRTQSETNNENIEKIINGSTTVKKAESATSATTAEKVGDETVGSEKQPVYFNGGKPRALSYTIETRTRFGDFYKYPNLYLYISWWKRHR